VSLRYETQFRGPLALPWRTLQQGSGQLAVLEDGLRLATAGARRTSYSNAQIDDYTGLSRECLVWHPPLRMEICARFPTEIHGTAGFGFWNSPITPLGAAPTLPAAIWFFYASPPSAIAPAAGVPGFGWKAACIDMRAPEARPWAVVAPLVVGLNQIPALYRRIWPRVQRALRVAEAPLGRPDPGWRTYSLEWRRDGARFAINGATVLETDRVPDGPLGFVAWIDTQYLIATPQGQLGWGLLDVPGVQYFDIRSVVIEGSAEPQNR
jgi:hypothetical protein